MKVGSAHYRRGVMAIRSPFLVWALLSASLVVGLAALVRMAGPAGAGPDDLARVIRLPQIVTGTVLTLFALAAVVILLDLVRRLRARRRTEDAEAAAELEAARMPAWLRALHQFFSFVSVVVFIYLIGRGVIPLPDLMALGQRLGSAIGPGLGRDAPLGAPAIFTWTYGALALAAGLAALGLALAIAFSERLVQWWAGARDDDGTPASRPAGLEGAPEDPRAEPDARRAIIRCYARFERLAADAGVERKPWHTPLELMREVLPRLPLAAGAVPTLTGLFELARFSRRALGSSERDRALGALEEITATVDARRPDASTS
jgi:uncharacterized membrane protein YhaH (DUF805 family)